MARWRSLQIFEALLVLGLLYGIVLCFRYPGWPDAIGIFVNLFLQYQVVMAISKLKKIAQLTSVEQAKIMERQKPIQKTVFIGCFFLTAVLMIDIGLFLSHAYSIQTCMFVGIAAGVIPFWFLMFRTIRSQKRRV